MIEAKILHIVNCLDKGGAERLLVNVLPKYKEKGIDVSVLELTSINSTEAYREILKSNEIPCYSLGEQHIRDPRIIFHLRSFLRSRSFDIIHVHLFPALYFTALAAKMLKKKPVLIFTEHSTLNKRRSKPGLKLMEKIIYSSYDKIVAISEKVKNELSGWAGNGEKIHLIRNGVDTKSFFNAPVYNKEYYQQETGTGQEVIRLFMTARFTYPKDQDTIVRALRLLPENVHAFFIGDGSLKAETERKVEEFQLGKRVHFLGFRTDVPSLIKSADINILSSTYEGMSGVTLEALAAGRPFLGSNVPGINDIVPDSRFLFKVKDETDLAFKIQEIINKPELQVAMIKEGLDMVAKFDIEIMVSEHIRLYNSLLQPQTT